MCLPFVSCAELVLVCVGWEVGDELLVEPEGQPVDLFIQRTSAMSVVGI